ncbi:hypothetical protein ACSDQ9_09505 [Aestuariimicrobium soli]|uniref:hypothetical protein n=1 Tax=Aestuariimicrobium soli TaxID=2035834 RepID=UPI003EB6957F
MDESTVAGRFWNGLQVFEIDPVHTKLATAVLTFRTGVVDETWLTAGWTHLIEHGTLHGLGSRGLQVNGQVDLLLTQLWFQGAPDDVWRALRIVCERLSEGGPSDVTHEVNILTKERHETGEGTVDGLLLAERFGARGPGLILFPEPGLPAATSTLLREFARSRFTADNAQLVVDRALPDMEPLPLPRGERRTPVLPKKRTLGRQWFELPPGLEAVVAGGIVRRCWAASALVDLLNDGLMKMFRDTLGWSYAPEAIYQPISGTDAHVILVVPIGPDVLGASARTVVDWIARQRGSLASQAALDELVAGANLWDRTGVERVEIAVLEASHELVGLPDRDQREAPSLTLEQIHDELERLWASLLVGVPIGAEPPDGIAERVEEATCGLSGKYFPMLGRGLRGHGWMLDGTRLSAGAKGGPHRVIDLRAVIGLTRHPDGGMLIVAEDGLVTVFEPRLVRDGVKLGHRIAELVPEAVHVPGPERPAEEVPDAPSLLARWF